MKKKINKSDYEDVFTKTETAKRIEPIIEKVLDGYDRIFKELSENKMAVEIESTLDNCVEIIKKLVSIQSVRENFKDLCAHISGILLISIYNFIENNINPVKLEYNELDVYFEWLNDASQSVEDVLKELDDYTEREIIILATALSKKCVMEKFSELNMDEYFITGSSLLSVLRFSKFAVNPYKTIKKLILKHKNLRGVYKRYLNSYKWTLKIKEVEDNLR